MSLAVRLYPAAWRERYGDELEALLADHPPALRDRIDLIRGAIDARLHPDLVGDRWIGDRRGFAPLVGFAMLVLAVVIMGNGPVRHDDYGTYRDGSAGLPFLVLSMALLSVGVYATIVRLPADDRLSTAAGVIAIVAGMFWAFMPWVLPVGLAFLAGLTVLAVGARRARVLSIPAEAIVVVAAALPAGVMVAQLFLPWYAMRVSGLDYLVVLAPLCLIWLVVGSVVLRGRELPATT
jgi:hypothetical protein